MNRFLSLFLPDQEALEKKTFSQLSQLPTVVYGNLIFLVGFCTTFIAEMLRGTYLTAAGSGLAFLSFLVSLILIKKDKIRPGLLMDSVGILIAIVAIVFLLHSKENIFEIYRSICFIVVMAIFNQLFSQDKKQLYLFFGASGVIWVLAMVVQSKDFFEIDKAETIAAFIIGSIAFLGSNAAILLLNKQKDLITDKAVEEKKNTDASLFTLKQVLNQSSENLQIGTNLTSQVGNLSDSFAEIKNLYDYLNSQSEILSEKTSTISNSSKQVMEHVKNMQENIKDQNTSLSQTSTAMTEISTTIQNINSIADERKESMKQMEDNIGIQQEKISELVREVEKVQQSTASISSFVATVNAVAGRTGLLAMNASIEAAHAGTSGKGFSVIAQEIRKLSDETNKNAHNIEEELNQIVELVANATLTARDCIEYASSSTQNLSSTIEGIEEILVGIGRVSLGIEDVLASLQSIVEKSATSDRLVEQSVEKINDEGNAIDSISEFTSVITQRVQNMHSQIATVEEVLKSVQEIAQANTESAEKLSETLKG